jgi:predicted transporter
MLSRAARLLVLASFLVSIGMHTSVLQAVAWAKMTVDFARRDTIAVSLEKTFDGRHPCPICWSLSKTAPSASLAAAPSHSRLGFVSPTAGPRVVRVAVAWDVAAPEPPALTRSLRPCAPPPKAVLS